jgi:hypothetical protein
MKIGILGSGAVGKALAAGFIQHNYPVMMGTSHPEKLHDIKAKVGSFADAAAFGDIVVLAVKGSAAKAILAHVKLDGKIVIDTTNPIADKPPTDGVLTFFTDSNHSLMEELQAAHPHARFVKAFSCIGAAHMVDPAFGQPPSMFICGNDADAKIAVASIVEQFGFDVEDMGLAVAARAIEPLCILWCIPGFAKNDWSHAFKLLR